MSLSLLWDFRDKLDADDNEEREDREEVSLVGEIKFEVASFVTLISTELDLELVKALLSREPPFKTSDLCLSMLSRDSSKSLDGDFEDRFRLLGQMMSEGDAFSLDLLPSLLLLRSYKVATLRIVSLC